MTGNIKKTRTFLYISNAIIAVMCVISIAGFFIMPAGQMKLSFKIDRDLLTSLRDSAVIDNGGSSAVYSASPANITLSGGDISSEIESTLKSTIEELGDKIGPGLLLDALIEELGDNAITLSAGAEVTTPRLLSSIGNSDEKAASGFIRDNFAIMAEETARQIDVLKPLLINTAERLLKTVSTIAIQSSFDTVKKIIVERSGSNGEKEFDEFVERVGLDEGAVGEQLTTILDTISDEGMTAEQIAAEAENVYRNIYEMAKSDPKYGADVLDKYEYDPEGFRDGVKELVESSGLQDEEGTVNLNMIIDRLIEGGLMGIYSEELMNEAGGITFGPVIAPKRGAFAEIRVTAPDGTDAVISSASSTSSASKVSDSDLRKTIKDSFSSYADKLLETGAVRRAFRPIHIVLILMGAIVLIHMAAWLYLLIKILVKLFKPNPGVTLWVPVVFGWSLISLLTLIPYISIRIGKPGSLLSKLIPGLASGPQLNLALRIASGGVIAAICGILLFIFGFVYRHFRHKLRDLLEKEGGLQT